MLRNSAGASWSDGVPERPHRLEALHPVHDRAGEQRERQAYQQPGDFGAHVRAMRTAAGETEPDDHGDDNADPFDDGDNLDRDSLRDLSKGTRLREAKCGGQAEQQQRLDGL